MSDSTSNSPGVPLGDPYLSEIRPFAFGLVPAGWMACDGTELSIYEYPTLYSILGTTYGGDGREYFKLPDLRGRTPIGTGSEDVQGTYGGEETVTLDESMLPAHTHKVRVSAELAAETDFAGNTLGTASTNIYSSGESNVSMNPGALASTGSGQAHSNMQPFLTISYCICVQGYYPPRS